MAERDPIVEFEHQAKIAQGFGDSHVQIPTADLVAVAAELARLRAQLAEAEAERDRLAVAIMPKGCPKFAEGIDPVVMLDEERKVWREEIAAAESSLAEANEEARDNKIHADDFRAEAAGLKDRLAASESKRATLAEECRACLRNDPAYGDDAAHQIGILAAEVDRLRESLQFYADRGNWVDIDESKRGRKQYQGSRMSFDSGHTARLAIEGEIA